MSTMGSVGVGTRDVDVGRPGGFQDETLDSLDRGFGSHGQVVRVAHQDRLVGEEATTRRNGGNRRCQPCSPAGRRRQSSHRRRVADDDDPISVRDRLADGKPDLVGEFRHLIDQDHA
jgi:hypothetical protein